MHRKQTGNLFGVASFTPAIISWIMFHVLKGPNADIYFIIKWFTSLAIIGFVLVGFSWKFSRNPAYLIIGLLGNALVLAVAFLLLLAMGISEP